VKPDKEIRSVQNRTGLAVGHRMGNQTSPALPCGRTRSVERTV